MTFGYCASIDFIKTQDSTSLQKQIFDAVVAAGYDYVELPLFAISQLTEGELEALKGELERIPCRACNIFFPPANSVVGEAFNEEYVNQYLAKMIPIAKSLGVEVLVFGNGGARNAPEGANHQSILANIRTILEIMDKHLAGTGITVVVEPLNKTETNMVNSYGEAAALVNGLANVKTMVDSYHVAMEQQDYSDVMASPEYLKHLHTAYPAGRLVPSKQDDASLYASFVDVVKKTGYNGMISIEGGLPNCEKMTVAEKVAEGLSVVKAMFQG